jgi:hypothetical protein
MRELVDLVAQNAAPGRMLFMTMVEGRPDFIRNAHEMSQFTARGVVGPEREPDVLRQLAFSRLLPSLLHLRGGDVEARIIFESRWDLSGQPQETLNLVEQCFPDARIQELKFTTMYVISRESLAATRCAVESQA